MEGGGGRGGGGKLKWLGSERLEGEETYRAVDDVLRPRVVVYVYRHAAQRRHFCRELLEPCIVLTFSLVRL